MITVIADDFTGAAEIAGLGWRHGLRADLLARNKPPTDADLIVYDSDSRNCSPAEARRRVKAILSRMPSREPETSLVRRSSRRKKTWPSDLAFCSPTWIYKKVDSVLRGNVVTEIEGALKALRLKRCLLISANPNAGRIIRRGRYYIRGTPLHQTDFRNDPRHPRLSAKVIELLGRARKMPLAILRAGSKNLREGINVGEVETFADVQHWASLADSQTLAVGGADFFQALLRHHGHRSASLHLGKASNNRVKERRSDAIVSTLFVCGSLAESSRRFLTDCRSKGWPVMLMPDELLLASKDAKWETAWSRQIITALRQHPKVVVGIGRPMLTGNHTPLRLGRTLTNTIKRVLSVTRPARLCVEGGATAALLLERMNWQRLRVEVEFATGVTGSRPHRCPEVLLICKPGSYTWPDEVLRTG